MNGGRDLMDRLLDEIKNFSGETANTDALLEWARESANAMEAIASRLIDAELRINRLELKVKESRRSVDKLD